MCCWIKDSNPETERQPPPRRQGLNQVFDRRGTWPHNPAIISTGASSPGLGPTQQSPAIEEGSEKNTMASRGSGADTPMHGQAGPDEQSGKSNSENNSRRSSLSESLRKLKSTKKSLTGSLKKATNKILGREPVPKIGSYFQQPAQGAPLHGMQSRPSNWQAPGSIPQQSMHRRQPQFDNWQAPDNIPQETAYGQPPPHCGFYPPTTQYLQGNNVYAPQQQNVPMHPIPTSFLPALAQNMTPYGYGTPAQQSFQGYNGAYNQLGFNMTYLQTQPHHGPYQPNGSYASSAQVQPALRSQPIQQLTSAINNSPDIASKAGCFEYLKGLTHVVGTQGRRQRLRTSEGFSEPPETVKSFRPHLGPDGGFCCPSCPKTYARVKHVKRHFLQHTGSRPFVCQFCGTDFERSDTWKRHYKRCAGRRGVAVEPGDHLLPSVNQEHINQEHINQEQSGSSNPMLPTGS